jgi:hypothetical protein
MHIQTSQFCSKESRTICSSLTSSKSDPQNERIKHTPGNRKAPSSFFFVDIISTAVQPLPLGLAVRMEWQTTAAYPRWRSRTAVSAYQSVLIALAAADNAALLLDGHLVTAAAAVARDEPDAAAGVADEGRDPCPSPQQYSLYHRGGTGTGRSRSQLPDPSTPPTRRPGGWSSHWSAGPVGWLGRRPPREPAQHPSHRGREPGGPADGDGDG